jgi:hypothetical protein
MIFMKKIMDGVAITGLTSLDTGKGSMGLTMDMFLDHAVQENALGQMTSAEKIKAAPSGNVEEGRRRLDFCWPHGHHRWLRHRS